MLNLPSLLVELRMVAWSLWKIILDLAYKSARYPTIRNREQVAEEAFRAHFNQDAGWTRLREGGKSRFSVQQAGLLKSPPELRLFIYDLLLHERTVNLYSLVQTSRTVASSKRIASQTCKICEQDWRYKLCRRRGPDHLAMLYSCRTIYQELLPLVYSRTHFWFRDPTVFLFMSHTVPYLGLGAITSVRIDTHCYTEDNKLLEHRLFFEGSGRYSSTRITPLSPLWKRTCAFLATLKNLKYVKFWLYTPTLRRDSVEAMHRPWLEATKDIKVTRLELCTRRKVSEGLLQELMLVLQETDEEWDFGGSPPKGYVYTRAQLNPLIPHR